MTAKRDGEPEQQRPFYESTSPDSPVVLTNNASTGKATLGIFRGTSNVSFTASAPEGYRVSYIDYRLGNSSDNYANSRMTRKVPALAKDYVQNDQGENVHPSATTYKADPITLSGGRSYYHVKTHTYDTTRVTMKFTPPENCIVKRIYIQDDNTGEGFDVKGDSYTYTPSSDTKLTVQVYFGRPSVEVNVNNYQQHKGSVQINDGSGATISTVSRDDDYAQATFFNANQDISVSIRPSEGYRFADAWVGTNASDAVLVSEGLDTASDFPNVTLSIPSRTENLFLRINFVSDNDPDTANLYVSKYVIDRSGNLQPFTDGAVDISGQNEISNPLITGNGECSSASLGQGQYTMGMSVITDTTLGFDVTLPADYILVSADSGYVQENAPTNLPFEVTYTESGETQRSEIKGSDLSNNGYYWTFDKSFVTNGRTIYVNVYYAPVYKLIYNANGGTGTVPATTGNHLSGSQAAIENNWNKLSREDSRFLGWSLTPDNDPNGVITDANVTFGSRDITLYAVWEAKEQYQVKYFGNCDDADDGHDDGTRLAVDTYYEGKTVTVRANVKDGNPFFVRTNYNFLGWARNQNATEPEYIPGQSGHDSFVINENTDLYAVWSENTRYTVLYRIVGDNQPDVTLDQYTGTYYGGTTLEKKNKAIDVSGYDFSGWSYDDAASDDADTFVTPEGNLVITGTFTPHTHNVTYAVTSNDNPAFNLPEPKNNVAYGSTVTGIAQPLTPPEGFTFTGWNVRDPEDAMEIVTDNGTTTSFKMPDHDVVLEGSFARQSYQLTYSVSGDIPSGYTAPGNETYAYNADVNVADKPEIAGYTFKGWTYEGTDYTGNDAFRMPAKNVGLKGVFTKDETPPDPTVYKLIYDSNEAPYNVEIDGFTNEISNVTGLPNPKTVELNAQQLSGSGYTLAAGLTSDNYDFIGWSLTSGVLGSDEPVITSVKLSDFAGETELVVYAKWKAQMKITYRCGISEGDEAWNSGLFDRTQAFENLDYFDAGNYTVKRNEQLNPPFIYLGHTVDSWTVDEGQNLIKVVSPAPSGGSSEPAISGAPSDNEPVTSLKPGTVVRFHGNIVLTAVWDNEEYTITYDGNGNDEGTSAPVDDNVYHYNDAAVIKNREGLTRSGYYFFGWNTNADGKGTAYREGQNITVTGNLKLYAVWKADREFTLTYDGNGATGGSVPASSTHKAGQKVTAAPQGDLVKTGCTFKEWNSKPNGSGTSYAPSSEFEMPEADLTLYAIWTDGSGKIVTSPGTGESELPMQIAFNTAIISLLTVSLVLMRRRKHRKEAKNTAE